MQRVMQEMSETSSELRGTSRCVLRPSGPAKVKCLCLALALVFVLASGDVVILHSGQVAGTVVGTDSLSVRVMTPDGRFRSLPKKDIIEVLISKGSRMDSLLAEHSGLTVIFDPTAAPQDSGRKQNPTCCGVPCCLGSGCLPAAEVVGGALLVGGIYVEGGSGAFLVLTAPFAVAGLTAAIGGKTAPGGTFGATCLGSYLGDLGGVILGVSASSAFNHSDDMQNYVLIGGLIGTIPGSIIGYNMSRRHGILGVAPPVAPPKPAKPKPARLGRSPVAWVALTGLELGTGLAAGIALAQPGLALTNRQSPVGYGLAALAPAAAAGGTALIGAWLDRKGSAWWALPGAYSGAIGGLLVAALAAKGLPAFSNASLYAMPFLPMWLGSGLGAVAGYRMGPSLGAMESASRFEPSRLGLAFKPDRNKRSREVAEVRLNLLSYRF